MPTTRRSARVAAQQSSSPAKEETPAAGTKRKPEASGTSPSAKRGKKNAQKEQKSIEDTMDIDTNEPSKSDTRENGDADPAQDNAPEDATMSGMNGEEKSAESNDTAMENKTKEHADSKPSQPVQEEPKQQETPKEQKPTESKPEPSGQVVEQPPKEKSPEKSTTEQSGQKSTEQPQKIDEPKQPEQSKQAEDSKQPEPSVQQEQPKKVEEQKQPEESAKSEGQKQPEQPQSSGEKSNDASSGQQPKSADTDPKVNGAAPSAEQESTSATNGSAIEPKAREEDTPSSILEKGIIYFFFRARVNVEDPQDVTDIARTYFVLRPIPHGAKLGDGPIGDAGNSRLIAVPKKVLPLSGKDRFTAFVEKAKVSFKDLKEEFLTASDYATKTAGTSHTPSATPLAEGVYAITTTGRESHLAYMITVPDQLGEIQKDIGLRDSGSYIVSAKNPKFPGPANTNIGGDPGYSQDIKDEFRDLRWMPLKPKLLDYVDTQFLLIGESSGVENATQPLPRDEKQGKEKPLEEMEKLEGEDEIRVKHLKGDDAVFTELGVSKKEYPKVPTTW